MTRALAEEYLARLHREHLPFAQADHFWEEMKAERFFIDDVWAIVQSHTMVSAPAWSERHKNWRVELRGRCLEGRQALLVMGLREGSRPRLISIMVIR